MCIESKNTKETYGLLITSRLAADFHKRLICETTERSRSLCMKMKSVDLISYDLDGLSSEFKAHAV